MVRRRTYKKKSVSNTKGKIKHNKSSYNGIDFKSNLEVYTYKMIESIGLKPRYEEDTYTILEKYKLPFLFYKSSPKKEDMFISQNMLQMKYTPDFVDDSLKFIIECKGYANEAFPLRLKFFFKYMIDNGMSDYDYYMPKNKKQVNQMIDIIKSKM